MMRLLVVDDERPARQRLVQLIDELRECGNITPLEVVGEAENGPQALELVERERPDLIFMDVEMPEMSGLDVVKRLPTDLSVIFTTAYDQYAISAFELGALDYLRKPFGADRLAAAITRIQRLRGAAEPDAVDSAASSAPIGERLTWAQALADPNSGPLTRLFVRDRQRIIVVRVADVERLSGEDDYVAVHTTAAAGGRSHLVYLTMAEFQQRLDPRQFIRIHRSHMVNLDHVVALEQFDSTRLSVVMRSGARVVASRNSSRELRRHAI